MFGLFLAGFRVFEVHGLPGLGCGIGSSPPGVLSLRFQVYNVGFMVLGRLRFIEFCRVYRVHLNPEP